VLLVDRRNHHLFQPLLYQVAMAGLSPAEIAAPIRTLLRRHHNVRVVQAEVARVSLADCHIETDRGRYGYDDLLLAAGAQHAYFGHDEWEPHAPGLKTLEQATEIRRRVLSAFEDAESETDARRKKALLTFAVVGGGPTGVELAGALGEMTRYTLARDYRNIDPQLSRIMLIEAGPRILPSFRPELSGRATRDLERLGVQVWTNSRVTKVDAEGIEIEGERIATHTALWAAGVQASSLGASLGVSRDRQGRVPVGPHLTLAGHDHVFVAGDQAHAAGAEGTPLPGVATVALQQGRYVGKVILARQHGKPSEPFHYFDKGQLATIGRSRAVLEMGRLALSGFLAWLTWLVVHIYYLSGFKNRLFVLIQWAWSYATFSRGARLIVEKSWRSYGGSSGVEPGGPDA
jgi:NADH dehydrogenase